MGIRVEERVVVYESVTMEAINPEYLGITEEQIREYMKKNPMPEDPAYSPEDLILDLTQSSGMLTLPKKTKPETREYVADLLNTLLDYVIKG